MAEQTVRWGDHDLMFCTGYVLLCTRCDIELSVPPGNGELYEVWRARAAEAFRMAHPDCHGTGGYIATLPRPDRPATVVG